MTAFTIYAPTSGEILRSGSCPSSDVSAQVKDGEAILIGCAFPAALYFVRDGEVISKGDSPSPFHVWNAGQQQWVVSVSAILQQRSALLAASDWTQLPDAPIAGRAAWASYRQALRDLPDQPGFPAEVVWPIPPA